MSATDFTIVRPYCISCGEENVDPHLHLGGDVDDYGRPVDVYGYKCLDCGERFHGYQLQQTQTYVIQTTSSDRTWYADDIQHAIDQHYDLFGALTNDGERDDSLLPDDERVLNVYEI